MDAALGAVLAQAVLHGLDLHVVPVREKRGENAALVTHVAVEIRRALPDAHGFQVLGLQTRHVPLVDGVIRYAREAHLAVRPGLCARPFDADGEIFRLAHGEVVDVARRAARTARIHADADVAVGHPFLGVHHLPALVDVRGTRDGVGMILGENLPDRLVAVLPGEVLRVWAVAQDDGVFAVVIRAVDVRPQHQAVFHLDGDVPFDEKAVAFFGSVLRVRAQVDVAHVHLISSGVSFIFRPISRESPAASRRPRAPRRSGASRSCRIPRVACPWDRCG